MVRPGGTARAAAVQATPSAPALLNWRSGRQRKRGQRAVRPLGWHRRWRPACRADTLHPCAAPEGIGEGGALLEGDAAGATADDAATAGSCGQAGGGATDAGSSGDVLQSITNGQPEAHMVDCSSASGGCRAGAPAGATPSAAAPEGALCQQLAEGRSFQPAEAFEGARPGYAFKLGQVGLGYYLDCPIHDAVDADTAEAGVVASVQAAAAGQAQAGGAQGGSSEGAGGGVAPEDEPLPPGPRHHWGQALQFLDRRLEVAPGRRLTLLAKRDGSRVRFSLRQGAGEWVERAPWRQEWGGGASVENPHVQRVHYCELLVSVAPWRRGRVHQPRAWRSRS